MNRIRKLRQEQNMSQKDLANDLGVAQSSISSWENGTYQPDHPTQIHLCYIFKCTTDYLMGIGPEALPGKRGWSADMETNFRDFLVKNNPIFVANEKKREAEAKAAEQEWIRKQLCEEDPEERAEAMESYLEDCWEKAGRIGTLEGFEINQMMESLSVEDRQKLVRVARAMFPEAALF